MTASFQHVVAGLTDMSTRTHTHSLQYRICFRISSRTQRWVTSPSLSSYHHRNNESRSSNFGISECEKHCRESFEILSLELSKCLVKYRDLHVTQWLGIEGCIIVMVRGADYYCTNVVRRPTGPGNCLACGVAEWGLVLQICIWMIPCSNVPNKWQKALGPVIVPVAAPPASPLQRHANRSKAC